MPTELVLRLEDFQSPERWRWVLCDPNGTVVARHAVSLDAADDMYGGFLDLHGWLEARAVAEDRRASMRRLTEQVGAWIGEHVLGPIGPLILQQGAPAVVRVQLPYEASTLLQRPFELAHVEGTPIALQGVSLVFEVRAIAGARKRSAGDRVRMLAVFSALPDTPAPLALRRQRRALTRLVEEMRLRRSRALELTVLYSGLTRDRLRAALEDKEGWDVLHVFGHGLAGGLLVDPPAPDQGSGVEPGSPARSEPPIQIGAKHLVSTDDFARFLRPARDRLKLVVLSACDPDAAVAEARQWLDIPGAAGPLSSEPPGGSRASRPSRAPNDGPLSERSPSSRAPSMRTPGEKLASMAGRLVREIGCAALAMRYPVSDDFGIDLCVALYRWLFDRGSTVPEALAAALVEAAPDLAPTALIAPILVGPLESAPAIALACSLTLLAPKALLRPEDGAPDLTRAPADPPRFVGRAGPLTRAAAALAPESFCRAVLFHGMACVGKTTCAAELVHGHARGSFQRFAWYKAPDDGADLAGTIARFAEQLEAHFSGLDLVAAIDDEQALDVALPKLTAALGLHPILVVIDNLESLLTSDGGFRDRRWGALLGAMIGHTGRSRLILTSRILPEDLADDARVQVEPLHALGLAESLLLVREQPNLSALLRGEPRLVRQVLAVAQGHPRLLDLAERQARTPAALHDLLDDARAPADGEAFFARGETALEVRDFLRLLGEWIRRLTAALPEQARTLLHLLACLEEGDRTSEIVEASWVRVSTRLGWLVTASGMSVPDASALVDAGLMSVLSERDGTSVFAVDPVVVELCRAEAGEAFVGAVDEELGNVWVMVCKHALGDEHGKSSPQMVDASRRGTPYLMRRERWKDASRLLQTMLLDEPDRVLVSEALPRLRRIADATRGTPWGLAAAGVLADALLRSIGVGAEPGGTDGSLLVSSRLPEAERLLRELLEAAVAAGDADLASGAAGSLASLLRAAGRAEEALQVASGAAKL